ncbi:hypothetical protein GCWU000341_00951 [Oribacterium sp. oral taxon 078 str. F0262]|uniref:hypothetical protein n=1 Tax=Oribacterium sp. oral taxon 078 TaxID=652706 RepID=UPI0001BCBAFD|nr:hypothetical protein [Oribacterium sp. oral taxon 078]EFE92310.1 hypothetical protein GCWU000341_00951 [Oribacterium sp. oral taxon 078 str. F0262]
MLDATSYESFITENRITKGIIATDKGFPESAAHEQFVEHPDLHYLNPIKRNSKFIEQRHHMLDFTGILPGDESITYRKEKCEALINGSTPSETAAKLPQKNRTGSAGQRRTGPMT